MGEPRTEMFWLSTDVGNEHSGFGDRLSTEKPFVSDRIEAGRGERDWNGSLLREEAVQS